MNNLKTNKVKPSVSVGVGLRYQHYQDVINSVNNQTTENQVDFIEVHAENFYAKGGLVLSLLEEVSESYGVSIHGTSLGLASKIIPNEAINAFKTLINKINPILVSDHASFSWGENILNKKGENIGTQHSGDLLPFVYNQENLNYFCQNVERIQQAIGRQLLIENLSSYINLGGHSMSEFEFLQQVCQVTGSGLLLDINNIYVNSFNDQSEDPLETIISSISEIDQSLVKEIHLAGCSIPNSGDMMIDDHSQQVNDTVWQAYAHAINKFGLIPTLIEWDNDLPPWSKLSQEANKARTIAVNSTLAGNP